MFLVLIDSTPDGRAALLGRVQEGMRQGDVRRLQIHEAEPTELPGVKWDNVAGVLIGPGCFESLEETIELTRRFFPSGYLGIVLENEIYSSEAVQLKRRLSVPIMSLGDLVQIAGFLMDCEALCQAGSSPGLKGEIIGMAQFKGGVGATTLTAAFGSCWARHGMSVVAVDFDDVNPQLTAWGRVGIVQKTVTSELLRQGEVPPNRVNELVHPVEGFEGRLVLVGQPDSYNESFHFKANVLEGSPSSSEFVSSLLTALANEFDVVVIDMGRSWGVATFSALPLLSHILLVTDDDGMSVRRTLDSLVRFRSESDDPDEFDLSRWSVVLNSFTGRLISPKEIAMEIEEMALFPEHSNLFTVPFSEQGRQWGAPGVSLYDAADPKVQNVIKKVASTLIPFRYEEEAGFGEKLVGRWRDLLGS